MPIVKASNGPMRLSPSMSPASNVTLGMVVVPALVIVAEPAALKKPGAVATTAYVPAGAVRLNVPSGLAGTVATNVLVLSYNLTVTALPARTCPLRVPAGNGVAEGTAVFVGTGVSVMVAVGDATGVSVTAGVSVKVGVGEAAGVSVTEGVSVTAGVSVGVTPGANVEVGVAVSVVEVEVAVGVSLVPEVAVAVGVSSGAGVEVAVGTLPEMVTEAAPVEESGVSVLLPVETRAVQSTEACPACNAFTSKVKTSPLVVALLPLLPAIATMKLPFCGPLTALTGSVPKSVPTVILLTSSKLGSYVQVNSAEVYPVLGTLFKLTVAVPVSPTFKLVGLIVVVTEGWTLTISRIVRK